MPSSIRHFKITQPTIVPATGAHLIMLIACFEMLNEYYFTASEVGIIPEIVIPYVPYFLSYFTAVGAGLLFKGKELIANSERLTKWYEARKNQRNELIGEQKKPSACGLYFEKTWNYMANSSLWASEKLRNRVNTSFRYIKIVHSALALPCVPANEMLRSTYIAQQLLSHPELLNLQKGTALVTALSLTSGIIETIYESGSVSASAYETLVKEEAIPRCKSWSICVNRKNLLGFANNYVKPTLGIIKGGLGAFHHSVKETAAIYVMMRNINLYITVAAISSIALLFDLAFQNFTFQGREFRKTFEALFEFVFGSVINDKNEYDTIADTKIKRELSLGLKIFIHTLNMIFIAIPAFIGHVALFSLTLFSSVKDHYKLDKLSLWQIIYIGFLAFVAALSEALTETVSAFDKVEEWVINKKFPEQEEISRAGFVV